MSVRTYRVDLKAAVGTMQAHVLVNGYAAAVKKAEAWANAHPDHRKHGPWVGSNAEVA